MELKQFISDTLLSITQGVEEANKISPRFQISGQIHTGKGINGEYVEFDVGIEVKDTREKGAHGGIGVSVIDVGGEAKSSHDDQQSHRLKFRVFITEK